MADPKVRKDALVKELKEEDLDKVLGGVTLRGVIDQPGFSIFRDASISQPLGRVSAESNRQSQLYIFGSSDGE